MAAPLQYLLKPLKVDALQKVSLVIRKIIRQFVNTLTVDDKNYLPNRDDLAQPIQMQLSQKQRTFSQLFLGF